jgi:hypothetical protein
MLSRLPRSGYLTLVVAIAFPIVWVAFLVSGQCGNGDTVECSAVGWVLLGGWMVLGALLAVLLPAVGFAALRNARRRRK